MKEEKVFRTFQHYPAFFTLESVVTYFSESSNSQFE